MECFAHDAFHQGQIQTELIHLLLKVCGCIRCIRVVCVQVLSKLEESLLPCDHLALDIFVGEGRCKQRRAAEFLKCSVCLVHGRDQLMEWIKVNPELIEVWIGAGCLVKTSFTHVEGLNLSDALLDGGVELGDLSEELVERLNVAEALDMFE